MGEAGRLVPFPILVPAGEERCFLIQDSFGLRRSIIPLFSEAGGLLTGLGTSFRIDPFGTFLTAQHVILDAITSEGDQRLIGLFGFGVVYGTVRIPSDCFVRVASVSATVRDARTPLEELTAQPRWQNAFDCSKLQFDPSSDRAYSDVTINPLRFRGKPLRVGEKVLAVGFPELNFDDPLPPSRLPVLTERMYGALGTVTALHPQGRDSKCSWPTFEVRGDWRSGMSGGPVFNEDGHVVGVVSSSVAAMSDEDGTGFAFWFEPLGSPDRWLPSVDLQNPGWISGYAVVTAADGRFLGLYPDYEQAVDFQSTCDVVCNVVCATHLVGTDDYVAVEPRRVGTGP